MEAAPTMDLERKPDFEEALRRFKAWWQREIIECPPVTVTSSDTNVIAKRRS